MCTHYIWMGPFPAGDMNFGSGAYMSVRIPCNLKSEQTVMIFAAEFT